MTREEMRRRVVAACDYGMRHPHILGEDNVKIVTALREVAVTDDAFVDKLAAVYQAQATQNMQGPSPEPEKKE